MGLKIKAPGSRYFSTTGALLNANLTLDFDVFVPLGLSDDDYYIWSAENRTPGDGVFTFKLVFSGGSGASWQMEVADDAGAFTFDSIASARVDIEDKTAHVKMFRVGNTITFEVTEEGQSMESENVLITNGNLTVNTIHAGTFRSITYTGDNPTDTLTAGFELRDVIGDTIIFGTALDPLGAVAVVGGDVKTIENLGSRGGNFVIDTDSDPYWELLEQVLQASTPGPIGSGTGLGPSQEDTQELRRIQNELKSKFNL